MKKLLLSSSVIAALFTLAACGNNKLAQEQAHSERLDDSLRTALATSDSLFSLLYDVTVGMDQISRLENIVSGEVSPESGSARESITAQMATIQQGLSERRKRIEELERKLANSNGSNAKLQQQIAALREQIDAQAENVRQLQARLEAANIHIAGLDSTITSLNKTVDNLNQNREELNTEIKDLNNTYNTVYYIIGSDKELKERGILESGGFLRSSKLNTKDLNLNAMTRGDKRNITSIPLDAKKAKVMTPQPESSYRLDKADNGMLTLVITNPANFWAASNFLVIKTN